MADIGEILHNIADHTETFHRFLTEKGMAPDIKNRLVDHIILEEKENTAKLQELHQTDPTPLTQKLLDHSYFLQRIMFEQTMPADLKEELLHHFIEEHQEWQLQLLGTATGHAEGGTESGAANKTQPARNQHESGRGGGGGGAHHGGASHSHGGASHHESSSYGGGSSASHHHASKDHAHATNYRGSSETQKSTDSGTGQRQPEAREWTVGPLWNQGD